jgi:DNA polymerase-3 subunit delta
MKSLLDDGMHPLQLLAALANQVRRLLLAKDFIVRDQGRSWSSRMTFPQFKATTLKSVQADDRSFLTLLDEWDTMLNPPPESK